jgi:hypothetical protein
MGVGLEEVRLKGDGRDEGAFLVEGMVVVFGGGDVVAVAVVVGGAEGCSAIFAGRKVKISDDFVSWLNPLCFFLSRVRFVVSRDGMVPDVEILVDEESQSQILFVLC